jgi:hypothetical protein
MRSIEADEGAGGGGVLLVSREMSESEIQAGSGIARFLRTEASAKSDSGGRDESRSMWNIRGEKGMIRGRGGVWES